jgi:hypothetical protein
MTCWTKFSRRPQQVLHVSSESRPHFVEEAPCRFRRLWAECPERTKVTQDYVLETIVETVERCKQASLVLDRKGEPVLVETPSGDLAPAYTFDARAVLKGAELMGRHLKMFTDKQELTGKDGAPLQQEYGVLVVPAKVSVAEWVEQARNLRADQK